MPRNIHRHLLTVFALLFMAACVTPPGVPAGEPCVAASFVVNDGYHGARRGTCRVMGENHVQLHIRPESDGPINDSPWYGFRITPSQATTAHITLRYEGGHHRYWPKVSHDGMTWQTLDEQDVSTAKNGRIADFRLELDGRPVWLSAQELILPPVYDIWNRKIDSETDAVLSELGQSKNSLPIYGFDVSPDSKDVLFLVGRQHPPEVSGAFAFFAFAETVFGDSELANQFRQRFRIVAIPLLNPDGVIGGNWRHNLGGVDLNRDWGPFTQPETQIVRDLLDAMDRQGQSVRMFVDFHSTKRNLFYTQDDDHVTNPPGFTRAWLENSAARLDNYPFDNELRPVSEQANGKNYMYRRYGSPSVTYEVGDETDRMHTREAARVFAEELMKLMLAQTYQD